MRKYYDLLTFDKECTAFGKKLGFDKVLSAPADVNFIDARKPNDIRAVKGKLNVVKGGNFEVNKAAVRKPGIHMLLDPVSAEEHYYDTATANIAKKNNVAIGISLSSLLDTYGLNRVKLLRNVRSAVAIAVKTNNIVIVSGASDNFGIRAPQDLASLGALIGLDFPKSLWCVSEAPKALLEKVEEK